MNLWIRSQNKKDLIPIRNELYVSNDSPEEHCIYHSHGLGNQYCRDLLGIYDTEERALEVLDEIHKVLEPKIQVTPEFKKSDLTGNYNWIDKKEIMQFNTYVYEMPEE